MDIGEAFKVVQLQEKLKYKSLQCSGLIQALAELKVFLEEDDVEGALAYVNVIIGDDE